MEYKSQMQLFNANSLGAHRNLTCNCICSYGSLFICCATFNGKTLLFVFAESEEYCHLLSLNVDDAAAILELPPNEIYISMCVFQSEIGLLVALCTNYAINLLIVNDELDKIVLLCELCLNISPIKLFITFVDSSKFLIIQFEDCVKIYELLMLHGNGSINEFEKQCTKDSISKVTIECNLLHSLDFRKCIVDVLLLSRSSILVCFTNSFQIIDIVSGFVRQTENLQLHNSTSNTAAIVRSSAICKSDSVPTIVLLLTSQHILHIFTKANNSMVDCDVSKLLKKWMQVQGVESQPCGDSLGYVLFLELIELPLTSLVLQPPHTDSNGPLSCKRGVVFMISSNYVIAISFPVSKFFTVSCALTYHT